MLGLGIRGPDLYFILSTGPLPTLPPIILQFLCVWIWLKFSPACMTLSFRDINLWPPRRADSSVSCLIRKWCIPDKSRSPSMRSGLRLWEAWPYTGAVQQRPQSEPASEGRSRPLSRRFPADQRRTFLRADDRRYPQLRLPTPWCRLAASGTSSHPAVSPLLAPSHLPKSRHHPPVCHLFRTNTPSRHRSSLGTTPPFPYWCHITVPVQVQYHRSRTGITGAILPFPYWYHSSISVLLPFNR